MPIFFMLEIRAVCIQDFIDFSPEENNSNIIMDIRMYIAAVYFRGCV